MRLLLLFSLSCGPAEGLFLQSPFRLLAQLNLISISPLFFFAFIEENRALLSKILSVSFLPFGFSSVSAQRVSVSFFISFLVGKNGGHRSVWRRKPAQLLLVVVLLGPGAHESARTFYQERFLAHLLHLHLHLAIFIPRRLHLHLHLVAIFVLQLLLYAASRILLPPCLLLLQLHHASSSVCSRHLVLLAAPASAADLAVQHLAVGHVPVAVGG